MLDVVILNKIIIEIMIARLVGRTLRGKIRPWNFSTEENAEKRSAFMSEKDIRGSLPDEELQTLENLVQ